MSAEPFTRNINPRTSPEVPILIKTGLKGNCQFTGLSCLSNQKIMVDVGVTWWDAFETHCGVRINPDIYTLQRQPMPGSKAVKHDLREQVKQLIVEFQMPKPFFTIYLVRSKMPPRPRPNDTSRPASPYIEAPQLSPATTVYREEIIKKKIDSNRKRTAAEMSSAATRPKSQFEKNGRFTESGRNHGRLPLATNQVVAQTSRSQRWPQSMANVDYHHNELAEGSDDDDDVASDITNFSQDSQIADLHTLGIRCEDIKSEVCNRARSNYTNIQFLKMRNELEQFKKNKPRWTKWLIRAPITSSILRELLDI